MKNPMKTLALLAPWRLISLKPSFISGRPAAVLSTSPIHARALGVEVGSYPAEYDTGGAYEEMTVPPSDSRPGHEAQGHGTAQREERAILHRSHQSTSDAGRKSTELERPSRVTDFRRVALF
jgi:hypothetical protein